MARCKVAEIARLRAVDGDLARVKLPEWTQALVVQNALDAVLYVAWSETAAPSPTAGYDMVVPGSSYATLLVPSDPNVRTVTIVVDYPGAVPATDAGLIATIVATEAAWAPTVGELS